MDAPKFSFSDVIAIVGFGFGFTQIAPSISSPCYYPMWIVLSTTATVMLVGIYYVYKLRHGKFRYRVLNARRGKEGDDFASYLRRAQKQIRVIHTVKSLPGPQFTFELLACLERGVEVIRIIPEGLASTPDIAKWLEAFHAKQYYREHIIVGAQFRMPFSFVIVDDIHVFAYFPDSGLTETATEVMHFYNREVAGLFRNVFQRLYNTRHPD